ncbi:MAG: PEP-CTERM sorting domain-containing protein [Verrucomicrobiota bacterium]
MKKLIISATAIAAMSISAQAASLIVGFDFSGLAVGAGNLPGNYAGNVSEVTGNGGANSNGTVYWDGSFGSSVVPITGFAAVYQAASISLTSNETLQNGIDTFAAINGTSPKLQGTTINGFGSISDNIIVFEVAQGGQNYENVFVSYAGIASEATTLSWSYSLDGNTYTPVETDNIGTGDSPYTTAFPALDGVSGTFYLSAEYGTVNSGQTISIDNIQIAGDVIVPEPSTYAMIAGLAVLGLAYIRRRR